MFRDRRLVAFGLVAVAIVLVILAYVVFWPTPPKKTPPPTEVFSSEEPIFRAHADCGPTSGRAPLDVRFRSRGTVPSGVIEKYRWDFDGDGTFDVNRFVPADLTHTFEQPGQYRAVLEVKNNAGDTTAEACVVNVQPARSGGERPNKKVKLGIPDDSPPTWHKGQRVNLSRKIPVKTSVSSTFPGYGPERALDGNPSTSWYTSAGDAANLGKEPFYEVVFPFDVVVTEIRMKGNHASPIRYDFIRGRFELFDQSGEVLLSREVVLPEPWRDTTVEVSSQEGVRRVRFTGLEDRSNKPGFGELAVLGEAPLTVARIQTTLGDTVPVSLHVKNRSGNTVRTLLSNKTRSPGEYVDYWDGRDNGGRPVSSGIYYAIHEYRDEGQLQTLDLSYTTGGKRYNPKRNQLPEVFHPFEDDLLTVRFTVPPDRGASEVLAYVGRREKGGRFRTLLNRVPFGVGTHTVHWDGFKPSGEFATPPSGEGYLVGLFGFTLPDNAILLRSNPKLSNVTVEPNYFAPSTPDHRTTEKPRATVHYELDKPAHVELTVTHVQTGRVLRRIVERNVPEGNDHTVAWDGRAEGGRFADSGDYRLTLRALDSRGNASMRRFALVRVFH